MGQPRRLRSEISPYLRKHAEHSIDWYPWGEEAIARARDEGKPLFVSSGYLACHYCHLMAQESFSDEGISQLLNDGFICIKVDKEERPDVDEVYMSAAIALNGSGGWPLSVFLTPDLEPFFAGTYFPPHDLEGQPGFSTLLSKITEMWKADRGTLEKQASELAHHIKQQQELPPKSGVSADVLVAARRGLATQFDETFAGFGTAPKFPPAAALRFLLEQSVTNGDEQALTMATQTLDAMMTGGIFDHLAGGFFRYSVDREWTVPHFEKMLYDNAQLAEVYLLAHQATRNPAYAQAARAVLDFSLTELRSPEGGFFTAISADSDGREGAYYLWTRAEIESVLGQPAATYFCEFYSVTHQGSWGGHTVLSMRRSLSGVASELGIDVPKLVQSLETSRSQLLEQRAKRPAPLIDDLILTGHSALMLRALCTAAAVLQDTRYLDAARRTGQFLCRDLMSNQGEGSPCQQLCRSYHGGEARGAALLEDCAYLADALISLYEVTGETVWLAQSISLTTDLCDNFKGAGQEPYSGALFSTPSGHPTPLYRPKSAHDEAAGSANAVAARACARLWQHTLEPQFRDQALAIASAYGTKMKRQPRAYCALLSVVDQLLTPAVTVLLSGQPRSAPWAEMVHAATAVFAPHVAIVPLLEAPASDHPSPLVQGRFGDQARAYLCEKNSCRAPIDHPSELRAAMLTLNEEARRHKQSELVSMRLPGRVSAEATQALRDRGLLPPGAYAELPLRRQEAKNQPHPLIARVGIGTHRVGTDAAQHRQAIRTALRAGLNLIDTSPSFAMGDSERVVGQVLSELISEGTASRQQLVIVSKVGVARGAAAAGLARRRKTDEGPRHTVALGDSADSSWENGAFSLDPDFIRNQVGASLERLGIEQLDICLLQSPEHLCAAGVTSDQLREALKDAFACLESLVHKGSIGCYGVLSNTFEAPASDEDSSTFPLSIQVLSDIAQQVGGADHHFSVLELPWNVVERGASQPGELGASLVARAAQAGLCVLSNRPLSAFVEGALLRLVDPPAKEEGTSPDGLARARYRVASLEAEFETTFAAQLRLAGRAGPDPLLVLAGALGQTLERSETVQQFDLAEKTLVTATVVSLLKQLDAAFSQDKSKWPQFRHNYVQAVSAWLGQARAQCIERTGEHLRAHRGRLNPTSEGRPWAERALLETLNETHITCVLLGQRNEEHVETALRALRET